MILAFATGCSKKSKEITRKEFEFIILVQDAKEVSYSPLRKKAYISLKDDALKNSRYQLDLGDDLHNEPQYSTTINSTEEYEHLMDSLLQKLPQKYVKEQDKKFRF